MADFEKDREEEMVAPVNFGPRLNDGDSVDSITSVEVTKRSGSAWTDVSSEFGDPSGDEDGDKVNVTLGAASDGDQDAGSNYIVRVTVQTTNSETLIATPSLQVTATGDTDAP